MTFSSTSSYVLQGSGTNVLTLSATQRGGVGHGERRLANDRRAADVGQQCQFRSGQRHAVDPFRRDQRHGGLSLTDAGTLILSGTNSYSGGTTVSAGTLQGTTASLQGSITNNATMVFNQATDGTYAGTINGTGTVGKSGSGATDVHVRSTSPAARSRSTRARSCCPADWPAAVRSAVSSGATLQATGLIGRAVTGAGTVTATGDLIIGNSQQAGQFNQGGAPGVGGTLNIGSNALVILSADTAILGSQTNLGPGGSLTALNGVPARQPVVG